MYRRRKHRLRRAIALGALAGCLLLAACQPPPGGAPVGRGIVSLDYCADQFVLGLADRDDILALSPDATASFSYMRAVAAGLPTVRPRAEDVLALGPGLVVRSYGGGANARTFFERAGVPVLQLGFVDGLADVRAVIRHAARRLGVPERGEALIAGMDARLRAVRVHAPGVRALYVTPAGYTAGPGTLLHDVVTAAGLENFQARPGWHPIPLERLAYRTPDLVAEGIFGDDAQHEVGWTPFRHPVARRTVRSAPVATLDGATTSCGGWFVADAVAALAAAHSQPRAQAGGGSIPAARIRTSPEPRARASGGSAPTERIRTTPEPRAEAGGRNAPAARIRTGLEPAARAGGATPRQPGPRTGP